jgi:hypothetical protein
VILSNFPVDFEISGTKVKCNKCAPLIAHEARQWINSVGWKTHLKSEIHVRALKHEEDILEHASQINRATEAALVDDTEHTRTDFALLTASSSITHAPPEQTRIVSANEQVMWESLDLEDIAFSAGIAPDNTADRRRVERELKDADMWDGMNLLGGFSDDNLIFNDQEDEVLAEALRNAGEQYLVLVSFPHPLIRDMPVQSCGILILLTCRSRRWESQVEM